MDKLEKSFLRRIIVVVEPGQDLVVEWSDFAPWEAHAALEEAGRQVDRDWDQQEEDAAIAHAAFEELTVDSSSDEE